MSDCNADEGNNGVFSEGNNIDISISDQCNADIAISIVEYNVEEEKTISTEGSNIANSISECNGDEEKNKSVYAEGNYTVISISERNGDNKKNDIVSGEDNDVPISMPTESEKNVNNIAIEEPCSGDSVLADRVCSLEKTLADVVSRLESVETELKRVNETPKKASPTRKANSPKLKSQTSNGKVSSPTAKLPQSPHGKNSQSPTAKVSPPHGKVSQSPTAKVPQSTNGKVSHSPAKSPHATAVRSSSNNSAKVTKTLSRSMTDESGDGKDDNKDDDGKPKIILKATPKQKKSTAAKALINEEIISQKDEPVRFIIRGRSERLYPPTGYHNHKGAASDGTAPDEKLKVNWVYGYRGKDCRDNLFALPSGEILYNMAGVVVLYDIKKHSQRHFTKHNQFVKCVAVHPNKTIVASGQVAGHGDDRQPHVLVWDATTFETLSSFGHGFFERGVGAVKFTAYEQGKYLVAFDDSDNHAISVWDWEKGIKHTEAKCSKEKVSGIVWNPIKLDEFCTYGQKNLMFWNLAIDDQKKMSLKKKSAIYEKVEAPKYVQSVVYNIDGDLVSGDSNGNILLFKLDHNRNKIAKSVSAHKGGVFCLYFIEKDSIILSSGKDGQFSTWSNTLDKLSDFSKIPEQYGPARSISFNSADQTYFIGTTHNCILQYDIELSTETALVHGHCDEMWGLETHPKEPIFATCAEDKMVCIWNSESKKIVWSNFIEEKAQCVTFHPTSTYLLIGTMNGTISILNYENTEDKTTIQLQSGVINDIKVSPDGTAFAAACRDTYIYLYAWSDDISSIKKPKVLKGHTSRVSHLDWSLDGEYMQTNSNDYELLFWHRETGSQVVNGLALRDVDWATWTCPIGFPVIGIWPEGADGTDINTCGRSNKKNLIATGDDFGEVKLFRYPSVKPKSENNVGKGHSSHVTCVRFIVNDSCLITVGGKDCSIMQWDLVKGE